jgi:uncharacterized damage-inducible protein DinB
MPDSEATVRKALLEFLQGKSAHASLEDTLADFPPALAGKRPDGMPHTAWQLVEHMRITLRDLLDFCTNSEYEALEWPKEYWPEQDAPSSEAAWKESVRALREDLKGFEDLARNPKTNLYAPIPWGDGQTVLREILLAGDHTSYHTGQLILVRRALGAWKE